MDKSINLCGSVIGQRLDKSIQSIRRVKGLQILLLNGANQKLFVGADLLLSGTGRRSAARVAISSLSWGPWWASRTALVRRALRSIRLSLNKRSQSAIMIGTTKSHSDAKLAKHGNRINLGTQFVHMPVAVENMAVRRAEPVVEVGPFVHNPAEAALGHMKVQYHRVKPEGSPVTVDGGCTVLADIPEVQVTEQ
jgi:hypothetical protein